MSFYATESNGYVLCLKLTPNASFNGFKGLFFDENNKAYLKTAVTVVPEKGKANKALIELLAKKLKISKSQICLISGETDHLKKLRLTVLPTAELSAKLDNLAKE